MSFFRLVPERLTPNDALPGISASEEDFLALIEALHTTIDTFQDTHPNLTYGDCIHAAKCVVDNLIHDYLEDTADA